MLQLSKVLLGQRMLRALVSSLKTQSVCPLLTLLGQSGHILHPLQDMAPHFSQRPHSFLWVVWLAPCLVAWNQLD